MKKRRISPEARAAWSANGRAHANNLIRRPSPHPEIEQRVQQLVDELTAACAPSCETAAIIESIRVSFRAVLVASTRPASVYLRHRGILSALTAHQSNLARCLKELRHASKAAAEPKETLADIIASYDSPRQVGQS